MYLVGAKNPETRRQIESQQLIDPDFVMGGFIDNDPTKSGTTFVGFPVHGGIDIIGQLLADDPDSKFVNLITGSTIARYEVAQQLAERGCSFTNLVHPDVDLRDTTIGVCNYIQNGVVIQAGATIGNNVGLHFRSSISHESTIGHSVFVGPDAMISGEVRVCDGAFIGANATVIPRVRIGRWATVGAGAVVLRDVPDYATVAGNPARLIRTQSSRYVSGDIIA